MVPGLPVCFLIFFLALLVQDSVATSSKKTPLTQPPIPLGDPSWALGLHLYKTLRSDSGSVNTLFSPLLVASSLGALGRGSVGTTASQLQDLLKAPSSRKSTAQVEAHLSAGLKSVTEANGTAFHLHASSAIFSKQSPAFSEVFVKDARTRFKLQHKTLSKGDSKADLMQLLGWAKAGLGGINGAPLNTEIHAEAGALILANTLCFKGLWEREFNDESVELRTFLGKKYTKVMMMHRAGLYHHHEDMENMVQVLEVTLWEGKASLVLLLPFHVESLSRLDKLLTPELLSKWLEKTSVTSLAISLPKANITSTLSLQKALSALGLTDVWDRKVADFSGVAAKSQGKLYLGDVLHWASLELAATAGKGSADLKEETIEKPKLFYADHPFIIFVRDSATGALLLIGALDVAEGEALHDEL